MIHIRNCATPIYASDSCMYRFIPWIWREVMLLGGWTEIANNGDAAWSVSSNNILEVFTDLYVDPAYPTLVKKASGSFSSAHAGRILSLFDSTNAANVVMANIISVPDTQTLRLDAWNLGKPWVTASSLTGRVHIGGQTTLLTAGAWTVLQAPGGGTPFQIRITCSATANRVTFDCLPRGDYSTTKLYTEAFNHDHISTLRALRINSDIDGELFMLWHTPFYSAGTNNEYWYGMAGGSLDVSEIAPTDLYPRFITECLNPHATGWNSDYSRGFCTQLNMLNFVDAQLAAYVEQRKAWSDATSNGVWGLFCGGYPISNMWKWCHQKVLLAKPWVVMSDVVAGGYRRGRLPWNLVNLNWEDWRTANIVATSRFSQGEILLPSAGLLGCDKYAPLTVFV